MGRVFLYSALIACLCATISIETVEGIGGGKLADLGEFSYTVALRRNGLYYCSGAIIDKQHVLTAAHCVIHEFDANFQHQPLQVVVGTSDYYNLGESGIIVDVEKVYIPNEYIKEIGASYRTGDIAVLKLSQSLQISQEEGGVKKVKLAQAPSYVGFGKYLSGFGWNFKNMKFGPDGNQLGEEEPLEGKLRAVEAVVVPNKDCNDYYRATFSTDKFVCARISIYTPNAYGGPCVGDNGAPLVHIGEILVGILTPVWSCQGDLTPHVFTNVYTYRPFILNVMRTGETRHALTISLPIQQRN